MDDNQQQQSNNNNVQQPNQNNNGYGNNAQQNNFNNSNNNNNVKQDDGNNAVRFVLIFFLGWIGSIIINHTSLRPYGFKSRTVALFFLTVVTLGIYWLVVAFCQLSFSTSKSQNVGYFMVREINN